jgi:multidrug efflux system outer membrane protein
MKHLSIPKAVVVLCLTAPVLMGCTVGPDFTPPQAATPQGWTDTALRSGSEGMSTQINTKPADEGAWWAGFRDPVLSWLVERAAASNLDIQQASLRIAEARAQLAIATADRFPILAGNGSYMIQRFSEKTAQGSLFSSIGGIGRAATGLAIPSFPNPYDQYQVGFDASWEPDLFGRVRRSVEAATADTAASVEDSHGALVSLEGEIARNYIDLRGAQLKLAIVNENLATQRDILTLVQQRRQAGLTTDLDVSNATAQVTNTQSQLPLLEREIALDIGQLSQLLAREPGALRAELIGAKPIPPAPPEIGIGLPGDLIRRRPDIRAAEAHLHAATARVGTATADLFPRITLSAALGTQAESFPDLAGWSSRFFNIGPSIEIPIFEGGKLRANVRLQDVREKEAGVTYANTVLTAVHEVENALVAYNTEQIRQQSLEATARENRDALTLAQQRYQSGLSAFMDVLDAERTLQQTELSQADSTAAISTDLIALYKALGGGWQQAADGSTAQPR